MAKTMKSFRLDEDACYDLHAMAARLGESETWVVEKALDFFFASGAVECLDDLRYLKRPNYSYRQFKQVACDSGDMRYAMRQRFGLDAAPIMRANKENS